MTPTRRFFERAFGSKQVSEKDHILVSEYAVKSPMYLTADTLKGKMEGMDTHILRVDRFMPKGKHLDMEKRHMARLIDFDNFMRGNPYPRMYLKTQ